MPVFLKKLIWLIIANWVGLVLFQRSLTHPLHALLVIIILFVADAAIWTWRF